MSTYVRVENFKRDFLEFLFSVFVYIPKRRYNTILNQFAINFYKMFQKTK